MKNTIDFYCKKCNFPFNSRADFVRHVNSVHVEPSKMPFKCSQCDKEFSRKDNFLRHLRTVHCSEFKKLKCEVCLKQFTRKDHFLRHMRCSHPQKFCDINNIADTNELYYECWKCGARCRRKDDLKNHIHTVHGEDQFECDTCGGKFKHKKNLLVHFKKCPFTESKFRKKICIVCGGSFVRKATILKHYREDHEIKFEEEKLKFPNFEEFIAWKTDMEKSTNSKFVIHNLHVRERRQVTVSQYGCHRSGPQVIKTERIRRIKFIGSKKLNAVCPAEIRVHQNKIDSTCLVTFRKTHLGHDLTSEEELDYLCLRKKRKTYPRKKISDVSHRSNNFNGADNASFSAAAVLCVSEENLSSNCDIHDSYLVPDDDPGNVEAFVCQYSDSILYYKRLHESPDERFPFLQESDMVLIFMSPIQKSLLQKHGNGVIVVDCSSGTDPNNFILHTIVVLDYDKEAVPVAFAISNRSDFGIFDTFLTCIKEQVSMLQPNTLMTGLQESYYNHWKAVMGVPEYHLFCMWHVRETWKRNINKIQDKYKQKIVRETLYELSAEIDILEFERKLDVLLNGDDKDLSEFLTFFRKEFVGCTQCWAYCYWPAIGIGINMQIESFHRSLKHSFDRTKNMRYVGLAMLVKFLRRKLESTIRIRKKRISKLKKLRRAHEQYAIFANIYQNHLKIEEIEEGWLIRSFQISEVEDIEKMYIVRRLQQTCPVEADSDYCKCDLVCPECQICAHLYSCTCIESAVRNNMCKHIHAVASIFNKNSSVSILECDEIIMEETPVNTEFAFMGTATKENIVVYKFKNSESTFDNVKECREKLCQKLWNIISFVSAADQPDQLKVVETLLEPTASAITSMTGSHSLPLNNYVDTYEVGSQSQNEDLFI